MDSKRILILDYSVDRSETESIKRWLPVESSGSSLFIDTEESFPDDLIDRDVTHVIHSGSALSITQDSPFIEKAMNYVRNIRDNGVSQMGICYGHQLICRALVGDQAVRLSPNGLEAGWIKVTFADNAMNVLGVREHEIVWQHHFDEVTELPEGSEHLATNPHSGIQAFINYEQRLFGTQFHPEFDEETGNKIFLKDRELLEKHRYDVDAMVQKKPSLEAGRVFFDFFLGF
jgi:GMP synthase-like glutamine amidotransferase